MRNWKWKGNKEKPNNKNTGESGQTRKEIK